MDEIALKAYKAKLSEREEIYGMHKNSYKYNLSKYKMGIIFCIGFLIVDDCICLHLLGNVIPEPLILVLWPACLIAVIALIIYLIKYCSYINMCNEIKIGPFKIKGRNKIFSILKNDEMQISTLKKQIAFIERERELQAKESDK